MDMAVKPRLGIGRRIGPDLARVAVRQIKGKEVCFLLDAADYNKHFTKIGLCMTGRMAQRHEHLLAGPLPVSNVILDDGVAAIKTALVPQPLENTLCSVTLLARAAPVFSKPLVHLAGERIQLRAPDRRCPPISRRLRIGQHLRNTVPADPKIPGNLASAQSILEMSVTHLQIQIHGVYPQALPKSERAKVDDFYAARDTTTVPLPWPSIAPPFTQVDGGANTGSVVKDGLGTDTFTNVNAPLFSGWTTGGLSIVGTSGADTFNVSPEGEQWMSIQPGDGIDTIIVNGNGTERVEGADPIGAVRLDMSDGNGIDVNLATRTITD